MTIESVQAKDVSDRLQCRAHPWRVKHYSTPVAPSGTDLNLDLASGKTAIS